MFPEERRQQLVARARDGGSLDVASVSTDLGVAPETIRRDLKVLESHGLLRRVHGGAIPVERLGFEGELAARAGTMAAERRRIAGAALGLLDDAESIFVDEGATAQLLAESIPRDRTLTVVTSALQTGGILAAMDNVNLLMIGGRIRRRTLGAVDHWATRMLGDMVIDLCFLGTNGITPEHGLTTPDPAVAAVKSAALAASLRRVLIADHTKFGVDSFCRFANVEDFEVLVTDSGLSAEAAAPYLATGARLIRA
ncbi:DeoR/GlpR family DNA-binding transcription regulator [Glycomyces xiaoerkulensis]|uniref:DeoR/GlpR family DNA-binding transcription regulator n=1 Tax=Glycomyces xiaoerkulensis TaxID=2038139 RepID=UPI000C25F5B6|nr:DeoR/GlpR family DNA-binding transcription regulator [Glycomyces xiaoerkulensis]